MADKTEMNEKDLYTLHATLLIIADEIDRVCQKNNIRYSLIGGSLIGAIRHKGFIPWDDDLDIGFMREEYQRFLKACETDLDPRFSLQTNENDPNYVYGFGKILLNETSLVQFGQEKTKHRKGIYVDIFPYDYVPDDAALRKKQRQKNYALTHLLRRKFGDDDQSKWGLKQKIAFRIGDFINIFLKQEKMVEKLNANMTKYSAAKTRDVSNMSGFYGYDGELVPARYFDAFISAPFENRNYQIIAEYDAFLTKYYGDYMKLPPVEKRRTHAFQNLDFGPYKNATFDGANTEEA